MPKALCSDFGQYIQSCRIERKLPLRKVAAALDIDTSTLSKIEKGERQVKIDMIPMIAQILNLNFKELQIQYLSQKLNNEFGREPFFVDVLKKLLNDLK